MIQEIKIIKLIRSNGFYKATLNNKVKLYFIDIKDLYKWFYYVNNNHLFYKNNNILTENKIKCMTFEEIQENIDLLHDAEQEKEANPPQKSFKVDDLEKY